MAFKLRIMRRIYLFILLLYALVFARADTALAAYYDEHTGDSETDAYIISSKEDLILMRDRVNNGNDPAGKYYKLADDIDLTSVTKPILIGYYDYHAFAGHFDGQGHIITFNKTNHGLFQYIKTGGDIYAVKNLHVKASVKTANSYPWPVFGIVNQLNGIIESCDFEGDIEDYSSYGTGGIVYYLESGDIINCTFSGTISTDRNFVGGIAARLGQASIITKNPKIKNCKVLPGSRISGGWGTGGIAGTTGRGYITGCDTVGVTISGINDRTGGIIGYMAPSNPRNRVSGNKWPTEYPEIGNLTDTEAPVTTDPTLDSDGDGLPDVWETDGVDVDGDDSIDIDLKAMGADPNVPDIFVEVDYMYKKEVTSRTLNGTKVIENEINLRPSDAAMAIVMEQFARSRDVFPNGINLHIDTGPDSIMDLKTGKKWGDLSRSDQLDYSDNFDTGLLNINWIQLANNKFDKARRKIFRYCIVVNKYNSTTSSGRAKGIPGQYFIIADTKGGANNGILSSVRKTAGTFMHELGHTLGLRHGGDDHANYKPNYLSIMNYLYQLSGLLCNSLEDATNYSEYVLPEIDKSAVNEEHGIDPNSVTGGKITGAKWKLISKKFLLWVSDILDTYSYGDIAGIAGAWIDFNQNSEKDTNTAIDFYIENLLPGIELPFSNIIPASINDWEHILFRGGAIGDLGADLDEDMLSLSSMDASDDIQEITLEEAEEMGLLHNPGDCEVSSVMPDVLYTGVNNQKVKLNVRNMFDIETTAHLQVTSDLFASVYSSDITFTSSADRTIELTVPSSALTAGKHALSYTLTCANEEVKTGTTEIEVQAVKPIVLKVGESETLTGTAVGAYALSVEDTSIASIEGSTVHALETGRTFIILKDLDSGRTVCSLPIYVTESGKLNPEDVADDTDPTDPTDPSGTTDATTSSNGSSGGCNSGFGLAALSVIALAVFKRR